MIDIFLSRPTWIDAQYEPGLKGFIYHLKRKGLNPRTLGATDYPTDSPLDEVIALMKKCQGTIILGYPQIIAQTGMIKDQKIGSPIVLGTEWNHIEAALSYSLHIPLLVLHDLSVSRGIFDRGALNSFIYAVQFSNPSWYTEARISGALTTWIKRLSIS